MTDRKIKKIKPKENKNGIFAQFRTQVIESSELMFQEMKSSRNKVRTDTIKTTKSTFEQQMKSYENSKKLVYDLTPGNKLNKFFSTEISDLPKIEKKIIQHQSSMIFQKVKKKQNKFRTREINIEYDSKWNEKNKIPSLRLAPSIICTAEFQTNIINDEIKVLMSNIQTFSLKFLNDVKLLQAFKAQDSGVQLKFNRTMEESFVLMLEISKMILGEFNNHLDKLINLFPPSIDYLKSKEIFEESTALIENANIFSDVTRFLKSALEVYNILIRQVDGMVLSFNKFLVLKQFLSRCRMDVSNIIFLSKSIINNYDTDLNIVSKILDNHKFNPKPLLSEKDDKKYLFKPNELNQRKRDLNNVLNKDELLDKGFEKKKNSQAKRMIRNKIGIESKIFERIIKYANKETKEALLSERLIKRFKIKSEEI